MISDDIREGSKTTTQCFQQYTILMVGEHRMTCALGAACLAKGYPNLHRDGGAQGLRRYWPELDEMVLWPDEVINKGFNGYNKSRRHDLMTVIIGLNDRYRWTREKIADWIDTLELPRLLEIPPRKVEIEVVDLVEETVTV
jgi:hypothetical protein